MTHSQLTVLRFRPFSDRFDRLDSWLQSLGASAPFDWVEPTDIESQSCPVLLPLHCGGFYQFGDPDWLAQRLSSLPPEILAHLKSGKLTLLLDGSGEGIAAFRGRLENLQRTLAQFGLTKPPIYLTSATNGAASYRRSCYREGMLPILQVIYFPIQFFQVMASFLENDEAELCVAADAQRDKLSILGERIFLSFNYMPRWWRYALMVHLYEKNLLNRGHISFFGEHVAERWKKDTNLDEAYLAEIISKNEVGVDPVSSVRAINALAPMTLDAGLDADRFNIAYKPDALDLYRQTFFSVVTESDFIAETGIRFTEKSVKPLALGHPVLIVGTAGVVEALENLGYRLRGGMFSHEYDEVACDSVRLKMVLRELDRVLHMNRYQFQQAFAQEAELILHNCKFSREAVSKHRIHEGFFNQILEALSASTDGWNKT
jgi:hypothetical protein